MPRLRRSSSDEPGHTRRKAGKGFAYTDAGGAPVRDPETLDRIRALALPPAWTDVWICAHANGHLQATGTDAAGRRQYRYHDDWTAKRAGLKFDRMLDFAKVLPDTRQACAQLFEQEEQPTRDLVLSAAIRLLDLGLFRVGGETYAAQNESYGLATVRRDHVRVKGDRIGFEYPAKSGVLRCTEITSAPIAELVRRLKARRGGGPELLAYKADGRWRDVTSTDINLRLKDLAGSDYSAKDFRTWNATVLGGVALAARVEDAGRKVAPTRVRRAEAAAVREVAEVMGNTPAVCRSSYIDPRLFDRFRSGSVVEVDADDVAEVTHFGERHREDLEKSVVEFLGG
jgi:DNA topoisomerase I